MSGVYCYFGVTFSGKTTLAQAHLYDDVRVDGRPVLILDCMPARNLRDLPHLSSVDQVLDTLYGQGRHAVYTPKNAEEVNRLFGAVHAAGSLKENARPIHVLWDEAAIHQSPHSIGDSINQAIRGWQHNECTFRIVTQRPADLHGVVFAAMPEVYCFRLEREADLERVRKELTLDPLVIKQQNQGNYETYSRDRFQTVKEQTHAQRSGAAGPEDSGRDAHAVRPPEVQQPPAGVPGALPQGVAGSGKLPGAQS